jgi:outer membrane receptor protein involved in Fe transport
VIDLLLIAALAVGTIPAFATETHQFDVPAEDAPTAVRDFASQAHVQILVAGENVREKHLHPVSGEFSTEEGLRLLLADSGLSPQYVGDRSIALVKASDANSPSQGSAKEGKKSSSQEFRLAQVDQRTSQIAPVSDLTQNEQTNAPNSSQLTEIVVTAAKRSERLLEVAQSVSVVTSGDLEKLGAAQFRDFANTIPGLGFTTAGAGATQITLRGVTTGFDPSPTVGIYVDEVPYGSSTSFAIGAQLGLDAALFDLDRVEILRGPQGTLYGASSMGGLIKYVTNRPQTSDVSGEVQTSVSDTQHGGVNYTAAAELNLPIASEKAAIRISGFESHDGGYIDNVAMGKKDVNRSDIYGGRLDLLLTPTEGLDIRLTGYLQDITRDGEGTADYTFVGGHPYGDLSQFRKLQEPFHEQFRLVSAKVGYDFGPVTLTSISSYQTAHEQSLWDVSAGYVPLLQLFLGRTYGAVGATNDSGTNKVTQELRLASAHNQQIEWQIGGFYTRESSSLNEVFVLRDLTGLPAPNDLFTYFVPSRYSEYAAFGDVTWHLSGKFDVTGGARFSRDEQTFTQVGTGLLGSSKPTSKSSDDITTYLANARYHFTNNAVAYFRFATGYRPGGPNYATIDPATGAPNGPLSFAPDKIKSYEVGFKAETLDRRFGIDIAAYDIDWTNIQVSVNRNGFGGIANAPGGATITGAELTLTAKPVRNFTATGAFAYQHAYLKEQEADLGASQGERLPNVPRFTGSLNADYQLWDASLRPTMGASVRYVSDRRSGFNNSEGVPGINPQYRLPAYTAVDLRGGVELNIYNSHPLDLQLYVHNVFDNLGQLSLFEPQFGARVAIQQPRTFGIAATAHF